MWLIYSLFSAVFQTGDNLISKKLLRTRNEVLLAFVTSSMTALMLLPYILLTGIPKIGPNFLFSFVITAVINTVTTVIVYRAFRLTELSLAVPLLGLSPVFLLLTSPLIIHEFPSFIGLIGVLIIFLGTFLLNYKGKVSFKPFTEVLRNPGQRLIVLACFLWAISTNFYKIGMQNSSPMFFTFAISIFISLALLPFLRPRDFAVGPKASKGLLALGVVSGLSSIFEWLGVNANLAVYTLAVRRLSLLLTAIGSYYFFKEKHFTTRVMATVLMIAGVILIAI